jgi:hypothetical protein
MSVPQISRITQTMIQGISDIHTCAVVGLTPEVFAIGRPTAESSLVRSAGEVQSSFGDHTLRKKIRQAIEINEAPMSTIHGLM